MLLKEILKGIDFTVVQGENIDKINIENIYSNHKQDAENGLFVCIAGLNFDGHNYVNDLKKTRVIIIQNDIKINNKNQIVLKVKDTRKTFACLVSNFNNNLEQDFKIIGITGTSGKTSTTLIIQSILNSNKEKCAIIGTINNQIDGKEIPVKITTVTTPDIFEIYQILNYIKQNGAKTIAMEVTAHALALNRVEKFKFEVAVFTNLSPDHLDYFKTMERYKETKFQLFKQAKYSVLNIDDPVGKEFYDRIENNKISFSTMNQNADIYATNINMTIKGICFDLYYNGKLYKNLYTNLVGKFAIYNILSGISATLCYGIDINTIIEAIKNVKQINGRCEIIKTNKDFSAIIDYAHTEKEMIGILQTVKEFTKGKIICIFGGGGFRYEGKHFTMGKASGKYADFTIITTDNPRGDDINKINNYIKDGIIEGRKENKNASSDEEFYKIILDREEAIKYAISIAKTGDTILCCGKGHETYQVYENSRKEYFSEHDILNKLMNE